MGRWRFRIVYLALLPALAAAACVVGYYTYLTASQFEQLGEQSIAQSTLLLVQEKVDRVEQQIIVADNAVFHLVDVADAQAVERTWPPLAERISPSVRAVVVLDDSGSVIAFAARASPEEQRAFRKILLERILPDLELEQTPAGQLRHLHRTYAGRSYLVSYKVVVQAGRRYYLLAHHDTGYIVREQFPSLFANEEGKRFYNVVDEENRRIYGPSLAGAGDYLVGRRFPSTLYGWRLQVAPKQGPALEAQSRSRRFNEGALIALAFGIILLGIAFLIYAADKERRLNALKSDFIANVSHELKTPLSVVRMFGELLLTKRVKSPEKQQEYLEIICRESERLSALIENVLDFAALERGAVRYELRETDVGEVVARAVETFRWRIEHDGVEVRLERSPVVPRMPLDEQAFLLAVVNLLDNAVKYGGRTTVDVSVARHGDEVWVRVRDHGAGIAPEDAKRIFDRFYRSRRSAQVRGSGIGLSLVKHIAEAHGGRAWAENSPDGGAVVTLAIPVPARRDRTTGPAPTDAEPPGADAHAPSDVGAIASEARPTDVAATVADSAAEAASDKV